jgi:hypothetical protein
MTPRIVGVAALVIVGLAVNGTLTRALWAGARSVARIVAFLFAHPKVSLPIGGLAGLAWLLAPAAGTLQAIAPYVIAALTLAGLAVVAHALITDHRANRALTAHLAQDADTTNITPAYAPPEDRWWEDDGE